MKKTPTKSGSKLGNKITRIPKTIHITAKTGLERKIPIFRIS